MSTHQKLESYLSALDKALGKLTISDRAEIITEIKSHILEAQEKNPSQDLSHILASLGEPENVANRYLIERGLTPGKPSRSPIIKWLVIGFLGTFGIFTAAILILIWSFTPLIKVDEKSGRVVLFGGMIDINEDEESVKLGDTSFNWNQNYQSIHGSFKIEKGKHELISIPFSNGAFHITPSKKSEFSWSCKVIGESNPSKESKNPEIKEIQKKVELNFTQTKGVKCDLELPALVSVQLKGSNGKMDIKRPQAPMEIELSNGKISFSPDEQLDYKYETSVINGKTDQFVSSQNKDALFIKMTLANGVISKD